MPVSRNRQKKKKIQKLNKPTPPVNTNVEINKGKKRDPATISQSYYQGIVPSPEMMEHYKSVDADLPNRLVKLTEDEAAHRRIVEKRITTHAFISQLLGQLLAIVSVGMICYLSYSYMLKGYADEGKGIAIAIIISIAALFLGKRVFKRKES